MGSEIYDSFSEGSRSLLRWIVAHILEQSTLVMASKILLMPFGFLGRVHVIDSAMNDNGRNANLWQSCQSGFYRRIAWVASSVTHPMPIRVNDNIDKIRVFKR